MFVPVFGIQGDGSMLTRPTIFLRSLLPIAAALALSATNGPVRRQLKSAEEFGGYSCAAGYAWFFADGRLSSCTVSRETAFGEISVPTGSEIFLTAEGHPRFVFLGHDVRLNGRLCRGGKRAYSTAFYPEGKLKTVWLAEDSVVDGVPCMRAGFVADVFGGGGETDFHENGRLKGCKLSRDLTLEGHTFRSGEHIRLDSNGKLASSTN